MLKPYYSADHSLVARIRAELASGPHPLGTEGERVLLREAAEAIRGWIEESRRKNANLVIAGNVVDAARNVDLGFKEAEVD